MGDTNQTGTIHRARDRPRPVCGHAGHSFLPCSDTCDCARSVVPGTLSRADLAA
jgi:hypothetical protein